MSGPCDTITRCAARQNGAALILCLAVLGALSLLGLTATTAQVMQWRMGDNLDASLERRIGANEALHWAEEWLLGLPGAERPPGCESNCAADDMIGLSGVYGPAIQLRDLEWWQIHGHTFAQISGAVPEAANQTGPWFLIEEVHVQAAENPQSPELETAFYRITSRGAGSDTTRVSIVESLLARPWGHESLSDGFPAQHDMASFCHSPDLDPPCGRVAWRWPKQ